MLHEAWTAVQRKDGTILTGHVHAWLGMVNPACLIIYCSLFLIVVVKFVHMWQQYCLKLKLVLDWELLQRHVPLYLVCGINLFLNR